MDERMECFLGMKKTILFDVDGVFLSEERYFDASSLTIWEMLFSEKYLGIEGQDFVPAPEEKVIRRVRSEIFANDQVLTFMKAQGINSNWDMVYLVVSYHLVSLVAKLQESKPEEVRALLTNQIGREEIGKIQALVRSENLSFVPDYAAFVSDFTKGNVEKSEMLLYLNQIAYEKCGISTNIFARTSSLWELCQETFQEWYLGDGLIADSIGRAAHQVGKRGFLSDEIPIIEPAVMREVLQGLRDRGYRLGVGTGRPSIETYVPLKELGILEFFDPDRIVTASHVLEAEQQFPDTAPLSKPHPYCYFQGYLTRGKGVSAALSCQLTEEERQNLLVVGDSVADLMAARSIGCQFAATLTGLTGEEAREKFEQANAEFILRDVSEIATIEF